MKIVKGLLSLLLSFLLCSAVFSACDTVSSELLFVLAEESVITEGDFYYNTTAIIRSREEFNEYFEAVLNDEEAVSDGVILSGSASSSEKFTAEYFEEGALILYRYAESDNYIRRTVKSLSKEGHVLILNVDRYRSDSSVSGDVLYYTQILEVSQADMAGFDLAQVNMAGLILDSENEAGYFFRAQLGGELKNFPFDAYVPDNQVNEHDYSRIIQMDSKVQTDIFSETYSQSYVDEEGWVRDNRFTDLIDGYDDAFFQDKQIVTFFAVAGGGAYLFRLTKTVYQDGVLKIFVDQLSLGMGHAAMVNWFAIVEIDKIPLDTEISIIITSRR